MIDELWMFFFFIMFLFRAECVLKNVGEGGG